MSEQARATLTTDASVFAVPAVQRACACGKAAGGTGKCPSCAAEERLGVQPKLRINAPGDRWEQEADRIADQVVADRPAALTGPLQVTPLVQRQPVEEEEEELQAKPAIQRQPIEEEEEELQAKPAIQRQPIEEEEEELQAKPAIQRQPIEEEEEELQAKPAIQRQPIEEEEEEELQPKLAVQRQPIEEEEEELLQPKRASGRTSAGQRDPRSPRQGTGAAPVHAPDEAAKALGAGGRPLSATERAYFEPRFGRDLSAVRIHDDAYAAAAATSIGARAYTVGRSIAFAPGQYAPATREGRRLMAHELAHTAQQGAAAIPANAVQRVDDEDEEEQAAPAATPTPPTEITFNFNPTIAIPAAAGGTATLDATTNGTEITWSIVDGTATKASGTSISTAGRVTLDAAQTGGSLTVRAENSEGSFEREFSVAATPTGIDSTAFSSDLNSTATHYGAAFQNTFTSADGSANVLENLRIGERFPGAPSPNAASHTFSGAGWPFGRGSDSFVLSTGTRNNDGSGGWALDDAGQFGPAPAGSTLATGDNVSTVRSLIDVGDHVQSHSNPRPRNRLPVTLTLDQEFHFYNPRAASGRRWTQFTTTAHSRTLRRSGDDVQFVTTVNGVEHEEDYNGDPAVLNLTASPANTPKSASPPSGGGTAPTPRTVSLTSENLPGTLGTGQSLTWSIVGNALGCTIAADPSDETQATLTIGTTAGTVTVQVAATPGSSTDRVSVRIT